MADQILIVENQSDIADRVQYNLEQLGFCVDITQDAETALEIISQCIPSLILMDLELPGMHGFEFCKALKRESRTRDVPICILSKQSTEIDRVLAFELGVDDYVSIPFSTRELVLRIRNILRRGQRVKTQPIDQMAYGPLRVDKAGHKVYVQNEALALTPIEFQLLVTLMERVGRVQSREDLLDAVWGDSLQGNGRMVDAHIRRMRAKLGESQTMIRTVRGVGYCFKPDMQQPATP